MTIGCLLCENYISTAGEGSIDYIVFDVHDTKVSCSLLVRDFGYLLFSNTDTNLLTVRNNSGPHQSAECRRRFYKRPLKSYSQRINDKD